MRWSNLTTSSLNLHLRFNFDRLRFRQGFDGLSVWAHPGLQSIQVGAPFAGEMGLEIHQYEDGMVNNRYASLTWEDDRVHPRRDFDLVMRFVGGDTVPSLATC